MIGGVLLALAAFVAVLFGRHQALPVALPFHSSVDRVAGDRALDQRASAADRGRTPVFERNADFAIGFAANVALL